MTRRTYERDAVLIEKAGDLEDLVKDKELIGELALQKLLEGREGTKKDLLVS